MTLAAASWMSGCRRPTSGPAGLVVAAREIAKHPPLAGSSRFGKLTLLGALELNSSYAHFGGLSGLSLGDDGRTLYAVSDRGHWFSARLLLNARKELIGLDGWQTGSLRGTGGSAVTSRFRDAEALERDRDGSWLVAFEWTHRIWRYRTLSSTPIELPGLRPLLTGAPGNGGVEALAMLGDGRLLVICERYVNPDGSLKGWLGRGSRLHSISYRATDGFAPTDLAALESGEVLVLERRYTPQTGVAIRIRSIALHSLRPGAELIPREVSRLVAPLVLDNFEGLAVHTDRKSKTTTVYTVSDNNFSPRQRTLLYQFRLERRRLHQGSR